MGQTTVIHEHSQHMNCCDQLSFVQARAPPPPSFPLFFIVWHQLGVRHVLSSLLDTLLGELYT